ncbi:MAG: glutamine--fructose-6-phosphate transaminase (isomerizing) [Chloroflexi bacterium]|nr:glutamine--fructose-6-phosphate transaminase (isomerizing) [Chloroflexota bacterium]
MCGIIAYTGRDEAAPILLKGLKSLEYRGYDSAGIAVLNAEPHVSITKTPGRVEELERKVASENITGTSGIGHTRWATHGIVNEANAHPHTSCGSELVLVHNGIVENYLELRAELLDAGHKFTSETDSEIIVHLIESHMKDGASLEDATRRAAKRIRGAAAIVVATAGDPGRIVGLRLGNAGGIVVGIGKTGMVMASDLLAVLPHTRTVAYLDSGEMAIITPDTASFHDLDGGVIEKATIESDRSAEAAERGSFRHFMLKEIHEQAESTASAMRGRVDFENETVSLPDFPFSEEEIRRLDQVIIVGMGTSFHSAMMGAYMIEELVGIPARAENASEFRYRSPVLDENTLVVAVTQSGETADTLAAMEAARDGGAKQIAVCETEGSQATRMADGSLLIRAGQEIGVASTKTMTNTIVVLHLLALHLGRIRGSLGDETVADAVRELAALPGKVGDLLAAESTYEAIARRLATKRHLLYLGRGVMFPAALEGALKMKEIAYIHAEGYAAGEMKHGAIALISDLMPTIALAPAGPLREKMVSNVNEVKARGGEVIAVATEGDTMLPAVADEVIYLPPASVQMSAILSLVPMQLLAYYTALQLELDPDKPRNLAKTVTVE